MTHLIPYEREETSINNGGADSLPDYYKRNLIKITRGFETVKCPDCSKIVKFTLLDDGWRMLIDKHESRLGLRAGKGRSEACGGGQRVYAARFQSATSEMNSGDASELTGQVNRMACEPFDPISTEELVVPSNRNVVKCPCCDEYATFELSVDRKFARIKHHINVPRSKEHSCDSLDKTFLAVSEKARITKKLESKQEAQSLPQLPDAFNPEKTIVESVSRKKSKRKKKVVSRRQQRQEPSCSILILANGRRVFRTPNGIEKDLLPHRVMLSGEKAICHICSQPVGIQTDPMRTAGLIADHDYSGELCRSSGNAFQIMKSQEKSKAQVKKSAPKQKKKKKSRVVTAEMREARRQRRLDDDYAMYAEDSFGKSDLGYGESGGTSVRAYLGGRIESSRQRH